MCRAGSLALQYHEIIISEQLSVLAISISFLLHPLQSFEMSEEEEMFLVGEEQADENGETAVLWKKRSRRQGIDPCESLPVYNTIHR